MLHIVKSQKSVPMVSFYCHNDDVVLLIEDAVYCANSMHKDYKHLENKNVFCLSEDINARGLMPLITDSVQTVDYKGFVSLTVLHAPSMTWD